VNIENVDENHNSEIQYFEETGEDDDAMDIDEAPANSSQTSAIVYIELDICSICSYNIEQSTLITTPCGHNFHVGCLHLDCFEYRRARCPMCRQN